MDPTRVTLLVVDDDPDLRSGLVRGLRRERYQVLEAATAADARKLQEETRIDVVLLDIHLPDGDGLELLRELRTNDPELLAIMMTGYGSVESAVRAMKSGAYEYLEKPYSIEQTVGLVRGALRSRGFEKSEASSGEGLPRKDGVPPIVGSSERMRRVLRAVERVATSRDSTVLIQGESGTGKELVARAIHYLSQRHTGPFVAINCASLNASLLESELFGYEEGSFTGSARNGKKGLFQAAHGGTLFLDEIGEMDVGLQAKTLRAIQEKAFIPVGGVEEVAVDIRIIASTNRNLEEMVRQGRFREDLYYRLRVIPIEIPPLRERTGDILELANYFRDHYVREFGRGDLIISPEAAAVLERHDWQGNVRALRGVMERATLVAEGKSILPEHLGIETSPPDPGHGRGFVLPLTDRRLKSMEKLLIQRVLTDTGWNVSESAHQLGINRSTLYNKMRAYSIRRDLPSISTLPDIPQMS